MKKRGLGIFFGILFVVFVMSFVDAETTDIKIKTLQYHDVEVAVSDGAAVDFSLIERFKGQADEYGDANFSITLTGKPKLNFYVYVKLNNEKIAEEKILGHDAGEEFYLEIAPKGAELIATPEKVEEDLNTLEANVTDSVETVLFIADVEEFVEGKEEFGPYEKGDEVTLPIKVAEELVSEGKAEIIEESLLDKGGVIGTGAVISSIFNKNVIYTLVGVVLFIIIIFVVWYLIKKRRLRGFSRGIKIRKLSELTQGSPKEEISDRLKEIERAEQKIKEAQKEIDKLKNEDKISELRKKMEKDREELEKLGG